MIKHTIWSIHSVKPMTVVVIVVGMIIVSELVWILSTSPWVVRVNKNDLLTNLAVSIEQSCASETYRSACYDKTIPQMTKAVSMEDAFAVTKLVQEADTSYQYCHVSAHALSARETKKAPSRWKDVVTRCPSGVCSNGCIHGAFQERFRTETMTDAQISSIKSEFINVCEPRGSWNPTGMERASCYHAMGHLFMYITNADAVKSNTLCEEIANKGNSGDFRRVCYDGNFMQIFQPLEPEDFALVKGKQPTKNGLSAYCGRYVGDQKASCLSEGWPLFLDDLRDPSGLVAFCSLQDSDKKKGCYNAILYALVVQLHFDEGKIYSYCLGLSGLARDRCIASYATRLIETDWNNIDRSVHWCKRMEPHDSSSACYKELVEYSTFNFHPNSTQYYRLCNGLPEAWQAECLKNGKK